jgi:hypothetical protein
MAKYGKRIDGTDKDVGWLGPIRTKDGYADMTEYSVGMPGTEETFRPSIVPGTHPADINYLRETGKVPEDMYSTSEGFAKKRKKSGKDPFYSSKKKEPKNMKKGGSVVRGHGCEVRGRTKGRMV